MVFENGESWRPLAPDRRGRHKTFASAIDAAFQDLLTEKNPFFDTLVDRWPSLFPDLPARPGRYEAGKIFLYVRNAPTNFALRAKLPMIRRTLARQPGAPKKIDLRLEIHA
ncbi:MAG: hypothetical protein ACI4R9_02435 [Kiritimatiellia bacterium]